MRKGKLISVLIWALANSTFIYNALNAQEISKADLEIRAINNFENARYEKAAVDFEVLNNMFPKDTKFAYFLGRSYLQSNQQITRATELLKFAALRNFGDDAYFYLGRAYLLDYQFEDATISLKTFKSTATTRQQEKYDIDYWLSVCENAKKSVGNAEKLYIDNLQVVQQSTPEKAFINNTSGKYIYVPEELRSAIDNDLNYHTLMYIPEETAIGEFLYFDSRSKKGRQSSDIYRVKRLTAQDYSVPEVLPGIVNTEYDEAYPFFDKSTSTLYFSSKGHNTSGGFDIFSTRFDSLSKEWSIPEKLSFPINSPYDDFLYSISKDHKNVIFLTNRNSKPREIEAYSILNKKEKEYTSPFTYDEIITSALLSPSSIAIQETSPVEITSIENPPIVVAEYKSFDPSLEYTSLISEAMDLQAKSDSLSWSAKDMKLKADKETDYLKKKEILANISIIDQESKRMQKQAEEKFNQAEQLRGQAGNLALDNHQPVENKNNKDQKQLSYKSENPRTEKNETYNRGVNAAKTVSSEVTAGFSILESSPYSRENPIPLAVLPQGLLYRIQLGAFSNTIPEDAFGGLNPVFKEKATGDTKYYVGNFSSIIDARKALEKVKQYGYPDAFIVSYYEMQKIPVQKAREIEFADRD